MLCIQICRGEAWPPPAPAPAKAATNGALRQRGIKRTNPVEQKTQPNTEKKATIQKKKKPKAKPKRDDLGHLQERPERSRPAGVGGEARLADLAGGVVAADGGQRTRVERSSHDTPSQPDVGGGGGGGGR